MPWVEASRNSLPSAPAVCGCRPRPGPTAMASKRSSRSGARLKQVPGSSESIAEGKFTATDCKARGVEWSVTRPQPDLSAAPVASTAAPGIASQPATTSRCP